MPGYKCRKKSGIKKPSAGHLGSNDTVLDNKVKRVQNLPTIVTNHCLPDCSLLS